MFDPFAKLRITLVLAYFEKTQRTFVHFASKRTASYHMELAVLISTWLVIGSACISLDFSEFMKVVLWTVTSPFNGKLKQLGTPSTTIGRGVW